MTAWAWLAWAHPAVVVVSEIGRDLSDRQRRIRGGAGAERRGDLTDPATPRESGVGLDDCARPRS
jgi:hypothetical protein